MSEKVPISLAYEAGRACKARSARATQRWQAGHWAAVRPFSLARYVTRHRPTQVLLIGGQRARALRPRPCMCPSVARPRLLTYKAAREASKLERDGAGAEGPRVSQAEGALSRHARALPVAPGLTVAGGCSGAQCVPSSARHRPFPTRSSRLRIAEHPEIPIAQAPLDGDIPTCQEVGPRGPGTRALGPRLMWVLPAPHAWSLQPRP